MRREWLQIPWAVRPAECAFQQLQCSATRSSYHDGNFQFSPVEVDGIMKALDADSGCQTIHLFHLPRGTLEWTEVAVVPEHMNVMRYNFDSYDLGDFIFMLFATELLVFDAAAETWSFAPHWDRICENLQEF